MPKFRAIVPGAGQAKCSGGIVDRLTYGGNIIETGTASYRLAHTKATTTPKPT